MDDIIAQQQTYSEDIGLKVLLKDIKYEDIMIHIVYLGDTFIDNYFNKKREVLNKEYKEQTDKKAKE